MTQATDGLKHYAVGRDFPGRRAGRVSLGGDRVGPADVAWAAHRAVELRGGADGRAQMFQLDADGGCVCVWVTPADPDVNGRPTSRHHVVWLTPEQLAGLDGQPWLLADALPDLPTLTAELGPLPFEPRAGPVGESVCSALRLAAGIRAGERIDIPDCELDQAMALVWLAVQGKPSAGVTLTVRDGTATFRPRPAAPPNPPPPPVRRTGFSPAFALLGWAVAVVAGVGVWFAAPRPAAVLAGPEPAALPAAPPAPAATPAAPPTAPPPRPVSAPAWGVRLAQSVVYPVEHRVLVTHGGSQEFEIGKIQFTGGGRRVWDEFVRAVAPPKGKEP